MSDVAARIVKTVVETLNRAPELVKPESAFVDDLGADDLDALEILSDVEAQFLIDLPDYEISRFATVGDLIAYVERAVARGAAP